MKRIASVLSLVALLLCLPAVLAQGGPGPGLEPAAPAEPEQSFALAWYTLDNGGTLFSQGDTLKLSGTIGQVDAVTPLGGGELTLYGGFWTHVLNTFHTFLPLLLYTQPDAPDLVVESITATVDSVTIVLRNQGNTTVTDRFWVDLYVNPSPPPSHVNQPWSDLGAEGLVWGVREPGIPLPPSSTLTLTTGDFYFWPELGFVEWPLEIGSAIYVQVDSANALTDYGAVLESHELLGGTYNNISGPIYVPVGEGSDAAPPATGSPFPIDAMPPRR